MCDNEVAQVSEMYLGNGSGAAPPGVEHHSVLLSFLQHLILHKSQTIPPHTLHNRFYWHQLERFPLFPLPVVIYSVSLDCFGGNYIL